MASVQDLANSIAQMEGFYTPGTIANRNNNPGNLRYAGNQVGQESTVNGKFATFATPDDGWMALQSYIQSKANSGQTLRDFVYQYAPPKENDSSGYLNYLSGQLGIGVDDSLGGLYVSNMGSDVSSGGDFTDLLDGTNKVGLIAVGVGILGILAVMSLEG